MELRTGLNKKSVQFGDEIIVIDYQVGLHGISTTVSDKCVFDKSDLENLGSKVGVIDMEDTGMCHTWGQCFVIADDEHDLNIVIHNINVWGLGELKKWREQISGMGETCSATIAKIIEEYDDV